MIRKSGWSWLHGERPRGGSGTGVVASELCPDSWSAELVEVLESVRLYCPLRLRSDLEGGGSSRRRWGRGVPSGLDSFGSSVTGPAVSPSAGPRVRNLSFGLFPPCPGPLGSLCNLLKNPFLSLFLLAVSAIKAWSLAGLAEVLFLTYSRKMTTVVSAIELNCSVDRSSIERDLCIRRRGSVAGDGASSTSPPLDVFVAACMSTPAT